jgi:predicted MFS family arabinose efflux permease
MPLGALLGGFLGEAFDVRTVFITMTALAALLIIPAQHIRTNHTPDNPTGRW